MWMARDTCSMNQEPSPLLCMETLAARRNQRLTALGVRSPDPFGFWEKGKLVEARKCLEAEPEKATF